MVQCLMVFENILHQFTSPKTNMSPEKMLVGRQASLFDIAFLLKDMLVFWGVHVFRYIILHLAPKITTGIPSYDVFHMTKTILRQKKDWP